MGPIWPHSKVREGLPVPLTLLQGAFTRVARRSRGTLKTRKTGRRRRRKRKRSSSREKTRVDGVGGEPNERRGPLNSGAFFQVLHKYSSEAIQMCMPCLFPLIVHTLLYFIPFFCDTLPCFLELLVYFLVPPPTRPSTHFKDLPILLGTS